MLEPRQVNTTKSVNRNLQILGLRKDSKADAGNECKPNQLEITNYPACIKPSRAQTRFVTYAKPGNDLSQSM